MRSPALARTHLDAATLAMSAGVRRAHAACAEAAMAGRESAPAALSSARRSTSLPPL